jgi:hypothetical protein
MSSTVVIDIDMIKPNHEVKFNPFSKPFLGVPGRPKILFHPSWLE